MEWGDLGRWAMEVEVEDLGGGRRVFCIAKYKWGTTLQTVLLLCNAHGCNTFLHNKGPAIVFIMTIIIDSYRK